MSIMLDAGLLQEPPLLIVQDFQPRRANP